MPGSAQRKNIAFSMRLSDTDLAIIGRAAHLRCCSPADFIRGAAIRAAEDIIVESSLIRASPEGFAAFTASLDAPGKPVPSIVELLERPAPWKKATEE
jgi:uncharacterized protein (DUF1778 family)